MDQDSADSRLSHQPPEYFLQQAMAAQSPEERLRWAEAGLQRPAGTDEPIDPTTHVLLLRQKYLAQLESGKYQQALQSIEQALAVGEMEDVCRQDAARVLVVLDKWNEAAKHLRLAARVAPANRRAFHLWTLGSGLYLEGELEEAETVTRKAMRWATTERPLIAAQLALVLLDQGKRTPPIDTVIDDLVHSPTSQGYGQWVLGMLLSRAGRKHEAAEHLRRFIEKSEQGRIATRLSLGRELERARAELRRLRGGADERS